MDPTKLICPEQMRVTSPLFTFMNLGKTLATAQQHLIDQGYTKQCPWHPHQIKTHSRALCSCAVPCKGYTWANTGKDLNSLFQLTIKLENLWKSRRVHQKKYRVKYFNSLLAGDISNAIYQLNKLKKFVNSQRNSYSETRLPTNSKSFPEFSHKNSDEIFIKLTYPSETLIESDSTKFEDGSESLPPPPSSIEQVLRTDPVEELFIPLRVTEDSKTSDSPTFCTFCKQLLLELSTVTLSCTHSYHDLCLRQLISNYLIHRHYPIKCLNCCKELQEPDISGILSPEDYDSYLNLSFQFFRDKSSAPFLCPNRLCKRTMNSSQNAQVVKCFHCSTIVCSSCHEFHQPGHNCRSQSVCKCPSCGKDWPAIVPPRKITCLCMELFCSFCSSSKCLCSE